MNKKSFLWILPYYPYPPITGGNVRIFNLIKHISRYYDIHLVSYCDNEIAPADLKALEEFCKRVVVVARKQYEGELPLIFQYYSSPEMTRELTSLLKDSYDFIQIDFLTMAYYAFMIKENSNVPLFFTEHDVSSLYFDKCFHNRHLNEKERYVEWTRMRRLMDDIYPLFDAVFTVSYNDAEVLKEKLPGTRVYPAPTGTDCGHYAFKPERESDDLVYVGHFLHYPNVDSVNFFLEEVFPEIHIKYPEIFFNIVGSDGEKAFRDICCKNVRVTGTVPDIRDHLYDSGIFVAPIRLGIGIRGKILEAMATGLPVISTSLGAEGVGAEEGLNILIADTPADFVKQIEFLMTDRKMRSKLVSEGSKFVRENYDWPMMAVRLAEIYEDLLQ
ncbi:MAG: glycosyltransferase family 4 protein [Elusimicrobiota bacterium]